MDEGKIKYEDLVSPDDSVKQLIEQLTELNNVYKSTLDVIKNGAKDIITQLKAMSSATSEGRAEIDESTAAANRLARAQKELKFAMSETGKEVAWLKSQTASQNKMSIEQQKRAQALAGSYDLIKIQVKDLTHRYKELSAADRAGAKGERLLGQLLNKKQQLADLDNQMKLHIQTLSAVEKAEQKLAFLRSAEGKRLMELKQLIADEIAANKTKKASLDEVAQAQERLRAAQAATRQQAYELNIQAREANRIAKLQAQLNLSEAGSYNQLAAQYELNKIKLSAMSAAERQAEGSGKQLEAETLALYVQMQKLQEATGNHRLSVGNYAKSWDGLGISVSQVVRELPAAAVSLNTFFLGISNNIPIVIDEIKKLRLENKELAAQGKATKSVVGSITKALFGWNTILVILLAVFSKWGKQIIDFIGSLGKAKNEVISTEKALKNINKELEKTNGSYGQNIVAVKKLASEWKNLTSKKEQLQWIRDNKTEFDKLGISIRNVNDAENAFAEHTADMVESLRLRAKAAAAMKLASDKYEEALRKQLEAEQEEYKFERVVDEKGNVTIKKTKKKAPASYQAGGIIPGTTGFAQAAGDFGSPETAWAKHLKRKYEDANATETEADAYFELSDALNRTADAKLKEAGIDKKHKKEKKEPKGPRQRDLTDQIWRNDLSIRKKYEISLSELQRDEFQKRKIEAIDATNATIREMQEKFRKNEVFISNPDNKYKALTPEQRKQIDEQQKEIAAIIENAQRKLAIDLKNIEYEQQIDTLKKLRQVANWRIDIVEDEVEKEKQLRLKQLNEEIEAYSTKGQTLNGEVVITGTRTPEQIAADQRKRQQIIAEYDLIIYNMRKSDIDAQLELVKKGTDEELQLLIHQNEIARKIALAENLMKPAEQRQSPTQINAQFDKHGSLIKGQTAMTNFDELQAQADAEFNIIKRNENKITIFKLKAERDRWKKMLQLAKVGAIDWSEAQIKQAEAMIKRLEREITEAESFMSLLADKGLGGALLTSLGFDDDQIAALSDAVDIVIDNIKSIIDAEVELAEKAVEAAEKRVEAAQSAYDAEVEARNNGYANNVATAKKELQLEKKNQAAKQKILEEAQRKQEAIDTAMQVSSLVTATANLWKSYSSMGPFSVAAAVAATAAMWGSFAYAKIKASQLASTASEEQYGEGGFEILEGGSHASGNDIDLHTRNSKGKNMVAEGGEAMAIINRRSTHRYRKVLPRLVDSINKGTFEDKFMGAFKSGDELAQTVVYNQQNLDLSRIEEDVRALKKDRENKIIVLSDGSYIEKTRCLTRHIK